MIDIREIGEVILEVASFALVTCSLIGIVVLIDVLWWWP
jgi:hypothetical protein